MATRSTAAKETLRQRATGKKSAGPEVQIGVAPAVIQTGITPAEITRMIAEAAYLRAEQRGFAGGHELDDWLDAETEIRRLLKSEGSA